MKIFNTACDINDSSPQNFPCFTPPVSLHLCNTHCKPLYLVPPFLHKKYFEGGTTNHIILLIMMQYSVKSKKKTVNVTE